MSGGQTSQIWPNLVLHPLVVDVAALIGFFIEAQHTVPCKVLNANFSPLLLLTLTQV